MFFAGTIFIFDLFVIHEMLQIPLPPFCKGGKPSSVAPPFDKGRLGGICAYVSISVMNYENLKKRLIFSLNAALSVAIRVLIPDFSPLGPRLGHEISIRSA
jgi:hypothetical protein